MKKVLTFILAILMLLSSAADAPKSSEASGLPGCF